MQTDADEAIDDDIESNEILEENVQDSDLTRLTEMVRNHYLNYLEKQLQENFIKASVHNSRKNGCHKEDDYDEMCKRSIKKTAELLEDKAVKACMIAKIYQRAMVKIIAIVRRSTQEKRLITHLEKCIKTKEESKPTKASKETQTEAGLLVYNLTTNSNEEINTNSAIDNQKCNEKPVMSLDEKIEMFQKHLQKEKYNDIVKNFSLKDKTKKSKRQQKQHHHPNHHDHNRRQYKHYFKHQPRVTEEVFFSPASSVVTVIAPITKTLSKAEEQQATCIEVTNPADNKQINVKDNEDSNDSVAVELARLFSEEKTELDEIFGIDPNEEPDDPQICKILKEIEDSKISHATIPSNKEIPTTSASQNMNDNPEPDIILEPKDSLEPLSDLPKSSVDLSKSIWPCELFMQRRKLSECLARLMDEDLRWHDIMKWKFSQLFGEDSDDEFTPCSPSIELDDVLIGSCIRRISPWVVKHLMKPMKDGLIANRFLFKKLAKNLARSIVMENQYPDESIIKDCVENFFCLHQAVRSLEDLDVDIPNLTYF